MRVFVLCLVTLLLLSSPVATAEVIRVAVASNFKSTLTLINEQFEANSNIQIKLSAASTGALALQIQHGAPFDVFFSADQATPASLRSNLANLESEPFCYAIGRLGLVGGNGRLEQLAMSQRSLAIANPVTAPYGRAALKVLARKQFSSGNARKLVRGNNAVQAYQFWYSKAVDLALVPMALAPKTATLIPLSWHLPLQQNALVLRPNAAVDAYIKWIESDNVRKLINQAGYNSCP